MANRVTMTICGTEYILVAEEDAAYMEKIGSMVDTEMRGLMDSAHMSRDAASSTSRRRGGRPCPPAAFCAYLCSRGLSGL